MLFMLNALLTWCHPTIKKGMLMIMISIESGIPNSRLVSSEIPVTPPSINPVGIKKPSSPNPAYYSKKNKHGIPQAFANGYAGVFGKPFSLRCSE